MRRILLIFCSILLWTTSCKESHKNHKADIIFKGSDFFEQTEIKQLQQLLRLFDAEVCKAANLASNDYLPCYDVFFQQTEQAADEGRIDTGISIESINEIMNQIPKGLKDKIWIWGTSFIYKGDNIPRATAQRDTVPTLLLNIAGAYVKSLEKEVGPMDEGANFYVNRFLQVGDISPSMYQDVFKNYSKYQIQYEQVRLLIAIHYLTILYNQQHLI